MSAGSPAIPVIWLMVFAMIAMGVYILDNQGILDVNIGTDVEETISDEEASIIEEAVEKVVGKDGVKVWCGVKVENPVGSNEPGLLLLNQEDQTNCGIDKTAVCKISSPTLLKYIAQQAYAPGGIGTIQKKWNTEQSFYNPNSEVNWQGADIDNKRFDSGEVFMRLNDLTVGGETVSLKLIHKLNLVEQTGFGDEIIDGGVRTVNLSFCVPEQERYLVEAGLTTGNAYTTSYERELINA